MVELKCNNFGGGMKHCGKVLNDKMLKKRMNLSLQFKIMAFFLVTSVLLTLILGIVFYNNTIENVRVNKETELMTLAKETSNKIERFLFEREADVQVMANSQILTMPQIDERTKLKYLQNVVSNYKTYDEIVVLNNNGQLLLAADNGGDIEIGRSFDFLSKQPMIRDKILSGKSYISDILTDPTTLQKFLFFSEPLMDVDGQMTGVVIERMNFNVIEEIIENVKLAAISHAELLPTDGKYGIQYGTIKGAEYLTVKVPIVRYESQSQQWMLKFSEPSADAFGIIKDIRFTFALVFCIVLIILFLVSSYLSKRITHPIKMLKYHMESLLSTHKLNMSVAYEGSSDEVKQMTQTFDFLLEELSYMVQKTMEKTAEAESVKSVKTSLDSMIEHTITGIITIDAKGVITSTNPRVDEILNLKKTLTGQTLKQLENQKYGPLFTLVEKSIEEGKQIEDVPCFFSEPEIQLVVSTLIQKDIYQTTLGVTVMIQNVVDKERFEHSVIRAKKLSELGELSAGVAHEIRNPLASIRGYTQMAILEVGEHSGVTHDLKVVLNEVDRLDRLIERFLSFTSPNMPSYEISDMNCIIEEMASFFEQQLRSKRLNLLFNLHNSSRFEFDCDQIRQVLINLILNAIQASHEGGQIMITSSLNDNEGVYILSIEDKGDGIPQELHDRIFTPFFTTRTGGSGLGLAICTRIVENHQGSIELISSKEIGTTIIIKLPTKRGKLS